MATPQRTAYIWGPVSSFTGPLIAWLVKKGWHVHVACKSSINLLSLSPLDLRSAAQAAIEKAFGGHGKAKAFQDRIKIVDPIEFRKGTVYDAIIFAGLPPNFDESRAPRAPWSAGELMDILAICKGAPLFIISSLYGGIQSDGVVPEELEFARRKPQTTWEGICQQYELRLLDKLSKWESPWYLVRLPILSGATDDGSTLNYTGLYPLLREVHQKAIALKSSASRKKELELSFNPNSTLWFMPIDTAVYTFWRFLEDDQRTRILNLIPTNTLLNMEWLGFLGKALGGINIQDADEDKLGLPAALQKLLNDNVMVKNRNLFEVAGRYHIPPVQVDESYFERIIAKAAAVNWGEPLEKKDSGVGYSDRLAKYYFEEFLPGLLNKGSLLDKALAQGHSIGFIIKEASEPRWLLKLIEGQSVLERFEPSDERPQICFKLSGEALVNLIQSKVPLHRALLFRWVEVEGPVLDTLKVTNLVERFFKENPVQADQLSKLQVENAAV